MSLDKNEDFCKLCKQRGKLICCDRCPSSYHFSVILIQCVSVDRIRETCQDHWYCPPCRQELRIEQKAREENWSIEKIATVMEEFKQRRELSDSMYYEEYEDPYPQLKQLTEFQSESSEEEYEQSRPTRVGAIFQSKLSSYGSVSYKNSKTYMVWNSRMLPIQEVDYYLSQAEPLWTVSYLNKYKPFNEADACKILHIKKYNVQNALSSIVHERHPYIVGKC